MKIEKYLPGETLRPFIKSFTIIESKEGMVNRILPDTSIVMALRIKGKVSIENHISLPLPQFALTGNEAFFERMVIDSLKKVFKNLLKNKSTSTLLCNLIK
jgi:hypothetical protein